MATKHVFTKCVVTVLLAALGAAACDTEKSFTRTEFIPPIYVSIESLAQGSTLLVDGVFGKEVGLYPVDDGSGDSPIFSNRVYRLEVLDIINLSSQVRLGANSTILVGIAEAAPGPASSDVGAQLRKFTTPVKAGVRRVMFLSPMTFGPGVTGWVITGGDYGSFRVAGSTLVSLAPDGGLAGYGLSIAELTSKSLAAVESTGLPAAVDELDEPAPGEVIVPTEAPQP